MRTKLGRWIAALVVLAGASAYATAFYYNETVSVTDVSTAKTFTDNGTGGSSAAFSATHLLFIAADKNGTPSANEVYINVKSTTADATKDFPLPPGARLSMTWDPRTGGEGWTGYGSICAAGETGTVTVRAER